MLFCPIGVSTADGPARRLGTAVVQVRRAALQRSGLLHGRRLLRLRRPQSQGVQDQSFIQVRSYLHSFINFIYLKTDIKFIFVAV